MKTLITLFFVLSLGISANSSPLLFGGDHAGNGGDSIGLEFRSSVEDVLRRVKFAPNDFGEINILELERTAASIQVIVVEGPLYAFVNGLRQISIAINFPSSGQVYLDRDMWRSLENEDVRAGIAFHELLGLMGLESTGDYKISQRLVGSTSLGSFYGDKIKSTEYICYTSISKGSRTYIYIMMSLPDGKEARVVRELPALAYKNVEERMAAATAGAKALAEMGHCKYLPGWY